MIQYQNLNDKKYVAVVLSRENSEQNDGEIAGFGLEIVYSDDANPARILLSLSKLVQACQSAQKDLAKAIPIVDIEPILIVENIEHHSILLWLKNAFEPTNPSLFSVNLEKTSEYFKKSIAAIVSFGNQTNDATDRELNDLSKQILAIANEANPNPSYPVYTGLPKRTYLNMLQKFQNATKDLTEQESASFVLPSRERISFSFPINFSDGNIEDMLTAKTIENLTRKILKIKKPDYLGSSQWEFKIDRIIKAKVSDADWIQKFHRKEFVLTPGDAIEADVKETNKFDIDLNIVAQNYEVIKVHEVLRSYVVDTSDFDDEEE